MSKNASKEGQLGGLHSLVAIVLGHQVSHKVKMPVFDAHGEIALDDNDEPITKDMYDASPQLLATAIKFLKDNEITATAEQSEAVADLADEVAERRAANKERADRIKSQRDEAMKKAKAQALAK